MTPAEYLSKLSDRFRSGDEQGVLELLYSEDAQLSPSLEEADKERIAFYSHWAHMLAGLEVVERFRRAATRSDPSAEPVAALVG